MNIICSLFEAFEPAKIGECYRSMIDTLTFDLSPEEERAFLDLKISRDIKEHLRLRKELQMFFDEK